MSKLPVLTGAKLVKILCRFGYHVVRQRGSHVRLKDILEIRKPITIPLHKTIKPGTLLAILRQAQMTVADLGDE